ncbi:MAG: glutamate-5-semialdehyde dehydrogenase [Deltaproteobacteria bacterium]|nr:glutamate-5-semialdehyde dehydrogenase [Deltaproteobacteria bacterium]
MRDSIEKMAKAAREASRKMAACPGTVKNAVLGSIAKKLKAQADKIKAENAKDVAEARERGLSSAMIDRLTVTDKVIAGMIQGLSEVAALADPIGSLTETVVRPNGLEVARMRIPLGVVCMIYESRPNVTVDSAGLCLKAGNAVILRGGSEAIRSNRILGDIIREALSENGLPENCVQVVPVTDREAVKILLACEEEIDLVIPRGGEGLIRFVCEHSRIPVLKHYKGVCHVYVDSGCDLAMAEKIVMNAKVQRPGVCNALETLLVHKDEAEQFLALAGKSLKGAGVEIRGCPKTCAVLPWAKAAAETDYGFEFLDLILAVKVVANMDEALDHIARYGSQHSEAIVTTSLERAKRFVREADASMVAVNASTRFNDGGQLGLGAEIGISTSKLHAFGPMGVDELTAKKFVVMGSGQVRS